MNGRRHIPFAVLLLVGLTGGLVLWQTGFGLRPTARMNAARATSHPAASTWAQPMSLPGLSPD